MAAKFIHHAVLGKDEQNADKFWVGKYFHSGILLIEVYENP
jgi:hypothetical protein